MLAMVVGWTVTYPVGVLWVALTGNSAPAPMLALWSGLAIEAVLLQVLAAVVPLYPAALFVMPIAAALAGFTQRRELVDLIRQWRRPIWPSIAAVGCLSLAVAYVAAGPVTYYDSALYHIQALRWLARDGIVPGLGLVELRFGIPSDWLALVAPFDAGPLQGRMTALANAYVVFLMATQSLFCWARLLSGRPRDGDLLLGSAFGLLIADALWVDTAVSASPDLPVAAFAIVVGWLIEVDGERARTSAGFGFYARVTLIAATATAFKLSAAPVLAIVFLYCFWYLRRRPTSAIALCIIAAGVLAPSVYAGIILNGCPAFPMRAGCLDLPWTIPAASAQWLRDSVTRFARWYASPEQGTGTFDWIIPYFLHPGNRVNPPLVVLALCSIAVLLVPAAARRALSHSGRWVFGLALADFAFTMVTAPDTRFGIGAIALLFGKALSAIAPPSFARSTETDGRTPSLSSGPIIALAVIGGVGLVVFRVAVLDRVTLRRWEMQIYGPILPLDLHSSVADRWLLPAPLPVIYGLTRTREGNIVNLMTGYSGDVSFRKPPLSDQCWGTTELCTPGVAAPLRFRRPEIGAAGGFVRAEP
jgi:hypothetical protein